jgi:hypothetical protein
MYLFLYHQTKCDRVGGWGVILEGVNDYTPFLFSISHPLVALFDFATTLVFLT